MQAFVINLAADTGRLAHMTEILGQAGVAFHRFDAIDAEQARRHPCFDRIPNMRVRPWLPGEIGCLLSHYEVWRLIAGGSEPYGMVFEDDIFVDPRLSAIATGACRLPRGADLVKLEIGAQAPLRLSRRSVSRAGGLAFHRLLSAHYGSGGYVISRKAASFLIDSVDLFDAPVDCLLFTPTEPIGRALRAHQIVPALVVQSVNHPRAGFPAHLASHLEAARGPMGHIALVLQAYRARQRQADTAMPPGRRQGAALQRTLVRLWHRATTTIVTVRFGS